MFCFPIYFLNYHKLQRSHYDGVIVRGTEHDSSCYVPLLFKMFSPYIESIPFKPIISSLLSAASISINGRGGNILEGLLLAPPSPSTVKVKDKEKIPMFDCVVKMDLKDYANRGSGGGCRSNIDDDNDDDTDDQKGCSARVVAFESFGIGPDFKKFLHLMKASNTVLFS